MPFQNCSQSFQSGASLTSAQDQTLSSTPKDTQDKTGPLIVVSSQPATAVAQASAAFVFSVQDDMSGVNAVECSLDNVAFASCLSPLNLSSLADGTHNVRIRATDKAGNSSPYYSYSWNISTTTPPLNPPAQTEADVQIVFPPPNSSTADSHLVVRGKTRAGLTISNLRVNGTAATSSDQFRTWKVDLALSVGANSLSVEAQVNSQQKTGLASATITRANSESELRRGTGSEWDMRPLGLAYEPVENRYILAVDYEDGIMGVDAVTGNRKYISDSEGDKIGDGYEIVQPRSGAAYGNKSFVVDDNLIVLIDNTTGFRSIFAEMKNAASEPATLASIVMTADQKNIIALSYLTDSLLYEIDTTTGASRVLSSKTKGTGADFRNTGTMGYSSNSKTAFVSLRYQDVILAVDTVTGNRRIFSQMASGEARFEDPEQIVVDDKNGLIYIWDSRKLYALDMTTGRRRLIATSGSFKSYTDIYGMALSPYGPVLLDYVPNYVTTSPQRGKTLMVIDPIEGTRVVISK